MIACLKSELEAARREKDEVLEAVERGTVDGRQAVRLVRTLLGEHPRLRAPE